MRRHLVAPVQVSATTDQCQLIGEAHGDSLDGSPIVVVALPTEFINQLRNQSVGLVKPKNAYSPGQCDRRAIDRLHPRRGLLQPIHRHMLTGTQARDVNSRCHHHLFLHTTTAATTAERHTRPPWHSNLAHGPGPDATHPPALLAAATSCRRSPRHGVVAGRRNHRGRATGQHRPAIRTLAPSGATPHSPRELPSARADSDTRTAAARAETLLTTHR